MKRSVVIVGLIWTLALLVANITAVWEPEVEGSAVSEPQFADPRVDIYGNEVSDAVGDYRIDRRGDLYERHAPDTAVLRLGPPGV